MKNIRFLDERNISFDILEGTLEVYDQNDKLVGEAEMNIQTSEGMSMEDVIELANQNGYDLLATISLILNAAVTEEQMYDVWLTEDTMIMYSPSANQYVAEPYEGVFKKILEAYEAEQEASLAEVELAETETEETNQFDDSIPAENNVQEGEFTEVEEVVTEAPEVVEIVEETSVVADVAEVQSAIQETEPVKTEEEPTKVVEVDQPVAEQEPQPQRVEILMPIVEEKTEDVAETPVSEVVSSEVTEDNRISTWKEAYRKSMLENKEKDGIKLSQLRDKVVEIVLAKNISALEVEENEVLFELLDQTDKVFEAKTALHAGLYQAYQFQKTFE